MVEGDRQPAGARRWNGDILKWCGKDLRGATLKTSDRTEWRKFVTIALTIRDDHGIKKKKKNYILINETSENQ